MTEWYLNWKIIFFFKKHLISLPCHLPVPRDNFSPQRANKVKVPKMVGLCMEFPGVVACRFLPLCYLFQEVGDTSQTRVPQAAHLTFQARGSGSLCSLSFPHICPGSLNSILSTAHCTFSSCSSMNKGSGLSLNSLDIQPHQDCWLGETHVFRRKAETSGPEWIRTASLIGHARTP